MDRKSVKIQIEYIEDPGDYTGSFIVSDETYSDEVMTLDEALMAAKKRLTERICSLP